MASRCETCGRFTGNYRNCDRCIDRCSLGSATIPDSAKRILITPGRCSGDPHFEGRRIPVHAVHSFLDRGYSVKRILQAYPDLTAADIAEADRHPRIPDTPMDFTIVAKDPGSSAVLDRMRVRRRWPWRKRR